MKNLKIFQILQTFYENELQEFRNFLKKYFKGKKDLPKILKYLIAHHPNFSSRDLAPQKAFHKIFGRDTPYKYSKLSDGYLELHRISLQFIYWKELQNESFEKDWKLLMFYRKKKAKTLYLKLYEKMVGRYSKDPEFGNYYLMRLHETTYFSTTFLNPLSEEARKSINEASKNLDSFFIKQKLRFANELKSREKVLEEKMEVPFLDIIREHIGSEKQESIIEIRNQLFSLYATNSTESFHFLFSSLKQNFRTIRKVDTYTTLSALLNYCIQQIYSGNEKDYYPQSLEVYQFADKNDLLIYEGEISRSKFSNGVTTGCFLKEFEWTEKFIKKWKEFLAQPYKDDVVNLALGQLYFHKGEHKQVIALLKDLSFRNHRDDLRARIQLVKSYYELEDDNSELFDYCNTFAALIRRKRSKIHNSGYHSHLNFVNFVKRLSSKSYPNIDTFEKEVQRKEHCLSRDWLLEKIKLERGNFY